MQTIRADTLEPTPAPTCPSCGRPMRFYGGTAGYICCEWKILIRAEGWFDDRGLHVTDDRLAGGDRRVDGIVDKNG